MRLVILAIVECVIQWQVVHFTVIYNHHHHLVPGYFHYPQSSHSTPSFHLCSHACAFCLMDFPNLDTSCKWNPVTCGLLCLPSLSQHCVLRVHPHGVCVSAPSCFVASTCGWTVVHLSTHPQVDMGGLFHFSGVSREHCGCE